jgi:hypothetical protein
VYQSRREASEREVLRRQRQKEAKEQQAQRDAVELEARRLVREPRVPPPVHKCKRLLVPVSPH